MPSQQLRLLVTGFGPFPGISENASIEVARRLAERARMQFRGLHATSAVLPTEWEAGPQKLSRLVAEIEPHLCVHLGVSAVARCVSVETIACNAAGPKLDANGRLPASNRLLAIAPDRLAPAYNPVGMVARSARAGLPVKVSADAGDYVCNAIFFHSLWLGRVAGNGRTPARQIAFWHLPVRVGKLGQAALPEHDVSPLSVAAVTAAGVHLLAQMVACAGRGESAAIRN